MGTAVISNNSLNLSSSVFLNFLPPKPPTSLLSSLRHCELLFPLAATYPFPSPNLLILFILFLETCVMNLALANMLKDQLSESCCVNAGTELEQ